MVSISYYDDIHSDSMNGQIEQNHYFYRHGSGFFRRQLLSFHCQKNALRIDAREKQLKENIFDFTFSVDFYSLVFKN